MDEFNEWLSNFESGSTDYLPNSIYILIRNVAAQRLSRERRNHTLQPTALVGEFFVRLMKAKHNLKLEDKEHFIKYVSLTFKHILIDYARNRRKQGMDKTQIPIEETNISTSFCEDAVNISIALENLKEIDERQSVIFNYRYYVGFTNKQIAELLGISESTIERDWRLAKVYLKKELMGGEQ